MGCWVKGECIMKPKVVILCGGLGMRLREETEYRPKPLVEVGGKPLLWHIMKTYAHYGFKDFILCLGYRGNMIKDYFLNYESMVNDFTVVLGNGRTAIQYHNEHDEKDFVVSLLDTGLETLTGGRIKRIEPYIEGDTFLMTYGDGLSDLNVLDLVNFHHSQGKVATVTAIQPTSRFGVLDLREDGTVAGFCEKPQDTQWISGGFFVFHRKVFDYLEDDGPLEKAPLGKLARDGQLVAYPHTGFWYAMDTYRDFLYLNELWNQGKAPWCVWGKSPPFSAIAGT